MFMMLCKSDKMGYEVFLVWEIEFKNSEGYFKLRMVEVVKYG